MNFLRLNDHLLSVLFENDEIIAIDKPYGINAHTNESKVQHGDFILDGLIEIYEKQLGHPLFIVHRLDQTTTGVMIFAKSAEAAKKYAEFFFNREVRKEYIFITAAKSVKKEFKIDKIIIHKGKELESETELRFLKKSAKFELWQANPHTGRNHQIRIHAQAAGISILGDPTYEGQPYAFLCLHNRRIEFPNGIVIASEPPKYFDDLDVLNDVVLAKTLFEADRRQRLFAFRNDAAKKNQSFRLVHNKNDFDDIGFTIDQFGEKLILSWYSEKWLDSDKDRFAYFADYMQKPIIVRLMYNRGKDPVNKSQFVINPKGHAESAETTWIAQENEMNYEVRTDSGQSFGLFFDQRLQRNWVRRHAEGKTVLNLFAYTCGFSAAAALGGATQVTSVDTNKNVLNWGRKNFEVNALDAQKYMFLCRDSLVYLEQCLSKNIKFDLIICDPPSFSRGDKGIFKIETALETLLENCLKSLNPNGDLLFSTNFENFYIPEIRDAILKVQKKLKIQNLEINCIQSAFDFELPGKKSILKSFLIRKK